MDLNNADKFIVPREIRRHPSELDRAPGRGSANKVEVRKKSPSFAEVAAAMNGAMSSETKSMERPAGTNGRPFSLWEKGYSFGFADFIDIINPLQHIPIVATIYRNFSSDQIGAAPRVIGGALWGRIGGLVTGLVNALVEWWSGKDIGDHIYAALFGAPNKEPNTSAVAQNKFPLAAPANGTAIPVKAKKDDGAVPSSGEKPSISSGAAAPNALRFEPFPLRGAARSSYERNRKWGEPDESLGVRFPA